MKNKKYITPKTQVKMIDTEMPIAESIKTVKIGSNDEIVNNANDAGFAKKGYSIWE
ncbi:MAG: hypothetical protein SPE56_06655 [Prevotella sp.]|nr:hypothetical protein [Prevotella sp.]